MHSPKWGGISEIKIQAHAKINVGLRVGGLRPDGYHEIWSVLQEIALCDDLVLREAPDLLLSVQGAPALPADEHNLCLKAARRLRAETGKPLGAHVELTKRIPIGAGLGGGSSDAAAVLKGLNLLWNLGMGRDQLLGFAAELGSDVPFFILGGACLAQGRGERLTPTRSVLAGYLLLVVPKVAISTSWAYKNIRNNPLTQAFENVTLGDLKMENLSKVLRNDFEPLIFGHYPALGEVKGQLQRAGAYYASLSGSGSSLYGAFHSEESARRAEKLIRVESQKYLLNIGKAR